MPYLHDEFYREYVTFGKFSKMKNLDYGIFGSTYLGEQMQSRMKPGKGENRSITDSHFEQCLGFANTSLEVEK